MALNRLSSPLRKPSAALFFAGACLQGCLFSWGGKDDAVAPKPRPAGGYYTFLAPADSSRLHLDSMYTVRWQASDSAGQDRVRLSLHRNDTLLGDIHGSLPATGSYDWDLAVTRFFGDYRQGSGSGYRLRITNLEDSTRSAFGPGFSLYSGRSGSLALTAPSPGARVGDSALRIAWTASGDVGDSVGLHLYLGARLMTPLANSFPASAGEFLWPIDLETMPTGDDYRIRIFALSDPAIAHLGPAFAFDTPDRYGAYEILKPRAGDVWMAGGLGEVEWSVTGNPGPVTAITLWRDSPRRFIMGWTPTSTGNGSGRLNVPADLASGTYRLRFASLADSTLHAFSPAFSVQGVDTLARR